MKINWKKKGSILEIFDSMWSIRAFVPGFVEKEREEIDRKRKLEKKFFGYLANMCCFVVKKQISH